MRRNLRQIAWFAGLWLLGVGVLLVVAMLIRLALGL